jgi:hypothetical protein
MFDSQLSELGMTELETCVVHTNSFKDVTHRTQFTGDKHQMLYYFSISCIVMLMAHHLYNQAVLCTVGSSCFWQRIILTDFEVLGHLCRCWQYTNVHLCSVVGQHIKGNNIYCKTKVILIEHFVCSCWWRPILAKTCRKNIKLIWATSSRCANRSSTVTFMHSYNTVAFACSDLFLPATCVGQSLWSSSGRDDFHTSVLKRRHTPIHFIDPTYMHRWINAKHVRCCMLLNTTWSKKHFK